ncbi:ABC transporter ATP-binding protein [Rhizobium sp. RAF56]|uniref:ABC transporter ATP-binding protein n=1 Tax=Rhizobium sp. RAF56 TaxID=3233062 RepID=UPI003F944FEC
MTRAHLGKSDVLVRFTGVNKSYDGETLVVRDLDLEVRRGEFLSLLGASGSGKTTTLMMLAGFERPTSGKIELAGRPLDNVPPWQRDIGIVFQSYALFPHMTVFQNIAFPLKQRRRPAGEIIERVNGILSLVKLEQMADRLPAQLSGGQQQRVALARALVFDPQLVLMDEPLGALDKRLREHMQLELKRIHDRVGVTIVYVTHDQNEALAMSDRVAVFAHGRIRQLAAPSELYERPTDALVADFVGENNRIDGTVIEASGQHCRIRSESGFVARALMPNPLAVGTRAILTLRPERLMIGDLPDCENRHSATVSSLVYLGDHARLDIALTSGESLTAKISNDARLQLPAVGETVTASWRNEDCRAFALEGNR